MSDGRALREQMVDALAAAGHIRSAQMAPTTGWLGRFCP